MRAIAVVALVACGSPPAPVVAPKPADPQPKPPPPACITPPEEAAAINHAWGDATHVEYCVGATDCFALALATGALTRLAAPPAPKVEPGVHVETTNPELKVCTGADCKSLAPQVWPGAAPLHAATNGAFAVVLLGDAEGGKGYADVYDVPKAKKIATFRYAQGDFRCGEVSMLGDTIYIGASLCLGPAARATLFSTKGKKLANVGGRDFGTFGDAHVQVDGPTWAFLEENGTKLALQNIVTGKLGKTFQVGALFGTGDALGNPGESVVVRLGADKLAVIAGTPANGSVATVDISSGEVQILRAPFCH